MSVFRCVLGGALCAAGIQIARGLKPLHTDAIDTRCKVRRRGKEIGREPSTRSAIEIYQFTSDQRSESKVHEHVFTSDNRVIGELESAFPHACGGCSNFQRKPCRSYPGVCVKLLEPTTPYGVCDLWTPREHSLLHK